MSAVPHDPARELPVLVLASSSPTRRSILESAGIRAEVEASGADEVLFNAPSATIVLEFAREKARVVAGRRGSGLVLGCDSMLDFDGVAYGKPTSPEESRARWLAQRGRSGTLLTGYVLIDVERGVEASEVVGTTIRFGSPSEEDIDAYVASGEPLDKAGSFTLEGKGASFLDGIDGDALNVRGLSLAVLSRLLRSQGHSIVDYWV